ncbi:MAG: Spi family protease inhibitor [Muribaculaceae bacterium]|nr:Spi family protease inhibitor [Muribaculaceae bacterium]
MVYILILLLLLSVSCSTAEFSPPQVEEPQSSAAASRSIDQAKNIALNAAQLFNQHSSRADVTLADGEPLVIAKETFSRSNATDTLLYVFNYADNAGFAVVSAAEQGEPLLAYIENGNFSLEDTYNGGFQMFMNQASAYVMSQKSLNPGISIPPLTRTKHEIVLVPSEAVYPKIEVHFGRNLWEGAFCPNGDAGKEAVATAQILSYFEKPIYVKDLNGKPTFIDWADIKKHHIGYHDIEYALPDDSGLAQFGCRASNAAHDAIGLLCYDIGDFIDCDYNSSETFSRLPIEMVTYIANSIGEFTWDLTLYHGDFTGENVQNNDFVDEEAMKETINTGFSLLVAVDQNNKLYTWVADGYMQALVYGNVYSGVSDLLGNVSQWTLLESNLIDSGFFVHYNWGDYGRCNGYFCLQVVDPSKARKYDNDRLIHMTGDYSFIKELKVVSLNIERK